MTEIISLQTAFVPLFIVGKKRFLSHIIISLIHSNTHPPPHMAYIRYHLSGRAIVSMGWCKEAQH